MEQDGLEQLIEAWRDKYALLEGEEGKGDKEGSTSRKKDTKEVRIQKQPTSDAEVDAKRRREETSLKKQHTSKKR